MSNLEIGILVAKAHRHHLPSMLPAPGINMGKLQQIVAHLALVSCKNHDNE